MSAFQNDDSYKYSEQDPENLYHDSFISLPLPPLTSVNSHKDKTLGSAIIMTVMAFWWWKIKIELSRDQESLPTPR